MAQPTFNLKFSHYLNKEFVFLEVGYNLAPQGLSNDVSCLLQLMLLQSATGMVSSVVENPYSAVQDLVTPTRTLASSRVECDLCGGTLSQ